VWGYSLMSAAVEVRREFTATPLNESVVLGRWDAGRWVVVGRTQLRYSRGVWSGAVVSLGRIRRRRGMGCRHDEHNQGAWYGLGWDRGMWGAGS